LQAPDCGLIAIAQSEIYIVQGAIRRSEAMAQLRQSVLLIASAFLVLQLTELVAATTGKASFYTAPFMPSACFGFDQNQIPADKIFAAGGDSSSANIWNNGKNCGKRFKVQCQGNGCNGHGPISVKIIDRCPNGCVGGRAFDLSDTAFATIANKDVGVITVQYSAASSLDGGDAETFTAEVGHVEQ